MMIIHMEPTHHIQPNTTQVPNRFIDELMPTLSDVELRVLLVITRQTLGWVEDTETGRRKDRDWISRYQMQTKTGRGHTQVSAAVKKLIAHGIIEALAEDGSPLDTAQKRQLAGGRIYYRLATRLPTLFDTPPKTGHPSQKSYKKQGVATNRPGQIPDTTKETVITKEKNTLRTPPESAPIDREKAEEHTPPKASKPPSTHRKLTTFFYEATKVARGITPIIDGAGVKQLKNVLDRGIPEDTIEQVMLFFLFDPSFKTFAPTMKTMFSAGVMTGLLNRMKNEPEFWKKLDRYASYRGIQQVLAGNPKEIIKATENIADLKAALLAKFSSGKMTHAED